MGAAAASLSADWVMCVISHPPELQETAVTQTPETTSEHESPFVKALGSLDALFIGFGAMIGFGWITLTGGWIEGAGTLGAVLAMIAGGILMALVGLVYSELVAAMPQAGGEHNYLLRGMGPRISMLGSWAITGGYIAVVLFEAVSTPTTAAYIFPQLEQIRLWSIAGFDVHLTWALVGSIAALLIMWINIRGVKLAGMVQTWVVSFLLLMAVLLLGGSAIGGDLANTQPLFTGGAVGFVAVLGAVPFLFVGFDVIPQSAEEIDIPPRRIGRLVVVSVLMAVAFYVVIIFSTSMALPASELGGLQLVTADAFAALTGSAVWGKVVIAGGLAGIITSWIAFLMGASRLMWAMANSGMLPAWFGRMHPRHRTPVNALLFIGILSALAPFFGAPMLEWAVDASSPMIVLTYGLVAVTFVLLRRNQPHMDRPLRIGGQGRGGVVIGSVAAVLCAILLVLYVPGLTPISVTLAWQSYVMLGLWIAAGVILMLRIPRGIRPGPEAEEQLQAALRARSRDRNRPGNRG